MNGKIVFVVFNINGDVIGVADSYGKALLIYQERYDDTPVDDDKIRQFELNKLQHS